MIILPWLFLNANYVFNFNGSTAAIPSYASAYAGVTYKSIIPSSPSGSYQGTQASYPSSPIYPGWAGVCINLPSSAGKTPQAPSYLGGSQGTACNSPSDCKYQILCQTNSTVTGGNQVGNYMCASSSGTCYSAASCHPVSHQCEGTGSGFPYFNPSCTTCTTNQSVVWGDHTLVFKSC